MLILTRRNSESIQIGKDITVTVLRVNRSYASIGVEAPREVIINRMEIHLRLLEEARRASASDDADV